MSIQITYLQLQNKYKNINNILDQKGQLDIIQKDLFYEIKLNISNKLFNAKINEELRNEFKYNYINYLKSYHLYDLKKFLINAKNSIEAPIFSKNEINILFEEMEISSIIQINKQITNNTLNDGGTKSQFKALFLYLYYIFDTSLLNQYIKISKQLIRLQNNYQISLKDYNLSYYADGPQKNDAKGYLNNKQHNIIDNFLKDSKINFKDGVELYNKLVNLLKLTKHLELIQFYTNNIEKDLIIKQITRNINKIKKANYSSENLEYLNKLNLNPININPNVITNYIKSETVQLSDILKLKNILYPKSKKGSFETISKNIIMFTIISIIILLLLLLIFLTIYMIYKTIKNSKCIEYFSNICSFSNFKNKIE